MKAPKPPTPTLTELANRITVHLERMADDPVINPTGAVGHALFYRPGAVRCGARIMIKDRSFQAGRKVTREAAERYLAWLDAGNSDTYGRFNGAFLKLMRES